MRKGNLKAVATAAISYFFSPDSLLACVLACERERDAAGITLGRKDLAGWVLNFSTPPAQ